METDIHRQQGNFKMVFHSVTSFPHLSFSLLFPQTPAPTAKESEDDAVEAQKGGEEAQRILAAITAADATGDRICTYICVYMRERERGFVGLGAIFALVFVICYL